MSDPKTALVPTTIDEAARLAKIYARSNLIPKAFVGKEAEIFLGISYGMELGFAPLAALRAVTVIQGRTGLYADAMVALVLQSGKAEYFRCAKSDAESATYVSRRRGGGEKTEVSKTFSVADAKKAGLLAGNYNKYPVHMLEARAKSWLARDLYPDVLHGIYGAEELRDGFGDETETDSQSAPVDAEFEELPLPEPDQRTATAESAGVPPPPVEPSTDAADLTARMLAARTLEELNALSPFAAQFEGYDRDNLRAAYRQSLEELKFADRDRDEGDNG